MKEGATVTFDHQRNQFHDDPRGNDREPPAENNNQDLLNSIKAK